MGLFLPPPHKVLEKKWTIYVFYFDVHFRREFVEFVVLLTNIWPKTYGLLPLQLNVRERAVQRAL